MDANKFFSRVITISIVFVVIGLFFLSLTTSAAAEESIDFGNVVLGSSITKSLTITNTDGGLTLYFNLYFKENCCDFSLNSYYLRVGPGATSNIEINYAPLKTGACSDILLIYYNRSVWKEVVVTGTGIEELKETGEARLLDSFDDYAELGLLKGLGPGKSADNRLKAFRGMLTRANDLIEAGKTKDACGQLKAAEKKLDSFVIGEGVASLRVIIQKALVNLGCQ